MKTGTRGGEGDVFEFVSRIWVCAVFVDTGILTDGVEPNKNGRHLNAFVDVHEILEE
jgi:hypothetical protein